MKQKELILLAPFNFCPDSERSPGAPNPTKISSSLHFFPWFYTVIVCNLLSSPCDTSELRWVCHCSCMIWSSCSIIFLGLPNFPISLVLIWFLVRLILPLESFLIASSLTRDLSFPFSALILRLSSAIFRGGEFSHGVDSPYLPRHIGALLGLISC